MMLPPILFEVPADLEAQVASRALRQVGALIVNPETGRIVAHMQETGATQHLLSALSGAGAPGLSAMLSPINAVTGAATFIQNRQIMSMISTLQGLQIGGLVISGLGLGVSLVSLAVVSGKLNRIQESLKGVEARLERIERRVEDLHTADLMRNFNALRDACRRIEEAWLLRDPNQEWLGSATDLSRLQTQFFFLAQRETESETISLDMLETFIDAALTASAGRVAARTAMEDLAAAQRTAIDTASSLNALTNRIGTRHVIADRLRLEPATSLAARADLLARFRREAMDRVAGFRQREELAAAAPRTVAYLNDHGFSGRAYLEAAKAETTSPVAVILHQAG